MKFMLALFFLLFGIAYGNEEDFRRLDGIKQEQQCSSAGGICTPETDCPQGLLTQKRELCPEQRSQGVECCYGLSQKETRCGKRGGVCLTNESTCNPRLVFKEATDCPAGSKCCIMTL